MDRQRIFDWVREQYGTEPDYPWADDNAVLRHSSNQKWYGLVMAVGRNKLGLSGEGAIDVLNVKCNPILIGSLRTQPGFRPAYHMNKDQWVTILLDGSAPEQDIQNLLDMSYDLTKPKLKIKHKKYKDTEPVQS